MLTALVFGERPRTDTRLCGRADDVDDIVQEAFLQAFMALGRLRDPDRSGAWLGGIIRNVRRAGRSR